MNLNSKKQPYEVQNEWISGEEFFHAELRRNLSDFFFFSNLITIPFVFTLFIFNIPGWELTILLPVGFNFYNIGYAVHRSLLKKIPRMFIQWNFCESRHAIEPLKSTAYYLEKSEIDFRTCSTSERRRLKGKTSDLQYAISLKKKNISIEFWQSLSGGLFSSVFHNWVCIRFDDPEVNSQYFNKIKALIEEVTDDLPGNNSFCRNCNKSVDATCYGPNFVMAEGFSGMRLRRILEKIYPYKDEKTFNELVETKKRLDGERPHELNEMKEEFEKYFD